MIFPRLRSYIFSDCAAIFSYIFVSIYDCLRSSLIYWNVLDKNRGISFRALVGIFVFSNTLGRVFETASLGKSKQVGLHFETPHCRAVCCWGLGLGKSGQVGWHLEISDCRAIYCWGFGLGKSRQVGWHLELSDCRAILYKRRKSPSSASAVWKRTWNVVAVLYCWTKRKPGCQK